MQKLCFVGTKCCTSVNFALGVSSSDELIANLRAAFLVVLYDRK